MQQVQEDLYNIKRQIKPKSEVDFCGTIYSNRNELCGVQQQSGKGSIEGIGSYQLFGQSSDEFHGSRRNRIPVGDHCGC